MKKFRIDKIFSLVMAIYSLIGAIVFVFTNIMLPVPMAELISIAVYYGDFSDPTYSSIVMFSVYTILFFISVISLVGFFFRKEKASLWMKVFLALVLLADFVIHVYAFLFASGYNFNYLIASAFDIFTLIAVFYENINSKNEEKTEDDN